MPRQLVTSEELTPELAEKVERLRAFLHAFEMRFQPVQAETFVFAAEVPDEPQQIRFDLERELELLKSLLEEIGGVQTADDLKPFLNRQGRIVLRFASELRLLEAEAFQHTVDDYAAIWRSLESNAATKADDDEEFTPTGPRASEFAARLNAAIDSFHTSTEAFLLMAARVPPRS